LASFAGPRLNLNIASAWASASERISAKPPCRRLGEKRLENRQGREAGCPGPGRKCGAGERSRWSDSRFPRLPARAPSASSPGPSGRWRRKRSKHPPAAGPACPASRGANSGLLQAGRVSRALTKGLKETDSGRLPFFMGARQHSKHRKRGPQIPHGGRTSWDVPARPSRPEALDARGRRELRRLFGLRKIAGNPRQRPGTRGPPTRAGPAPSTGWSIFKKPGDRHPAAARGLPNGVTPGRCRRTASGTPPNVQLGNPRWGAAASAATENRWRAPGGERELPRKRPASPATGWAGGACARLAFQISRPPDEGLRSARPPPPLIWRQGPFRPAPRPHSGPTTNRRFRISPSFRAPS